MLVGVGQVFMGGNRSGWGGGAPDPPNIWKLIIKFLV